MNYSLNYLFLSLSLILSPMNSEAKPNEKVNSISSPMITHTLRLKPGQDILEELTSWAKEKKIKAATILSVVGSFTKVNLRYANQPKGTSQEGHFEIVSFVGTFNESSAHLHASISNEKGETFGGHLLTGNIVYTTAEIVVGELTEAVYTREKDEKSLGGSGLDELVMRKK